MIGFVERHEPTEGYGFIRAEDGSEYLFHHSSARGIKFEEFQVGMRVEFLPSAHSSDPDDVGEEPKAMFVRPAPETPAT